MFLGLPTGEDIHSQPFKQSGAMNEQEWIQALTRFQAHCRGYVMRKCLSLIRTQFEEIVREIDGGLDHLQWRGNIIAKPHFTDTESLLLQYESSRIQSHYLLDNSEKEQKIENDESDESLPQSEIQVPERDEATETTSRDASTPVDGIVDKRGENVAVQNLMDDSTIHSTIHSNVSYGSLFQTGSNLHSVLKDKAHTPDSLKQHRSTLAMELLWIQQAISSRKKYLTLKQRMDVPH